MAHSFEIINGQLCHVNRPNLYKYKGIIFEFHEYCGPARFTKKLKRSKKPLGKKFMETFRIWYKLSDEQKKKTLISS